MTTKRSITAEDLTKLEVISEAQFIPNSNGYSFISTKVNEENEYESNIFFHHLNRDNPVQWTYGKSKNSNLSYSPDGKQVAFQSDRSGSPQIWLMNTDGGEAEQLTTFKHGASQPNFSPCGTYLIFTAPLNKDDDIHKQTELSKEEKRKKEEKKKFEPLTVTTLKYKSDAKGLHDETKSHLIRYDLKENKYTKLTEGDFHHQYQDISPCGKKLLFTTNYNDDADYELTNDLYLLDLTTMENEKLNKEIGTHQRAVFSPSGEKIACFGHDYSYAGATLTKLYSIDLKTGTHTNLSKGWDLQLGDLIAGDTRLGTSEAGPCWSKDESRIFFLATEHGATGLYQSDLTGKLEVIYKEDNHVFGFSYHQENEKFILGISTPTNPADFYLLEQGSEPKALTDTNREILEEVSLSVPEELQMKAEDGWDIQGWLLKPYGFEEGKKYPFILEIHGGPHVSYGQTFFLEMQLLAAKGYVVLYTNPRGSHGYGQAFVDACRGDYGGGDYRDLMAAVDHVLDHYSFIDEDRLGVTGGSYGGFMTNWIVSHTDRFKAAVTQRSISNWLSFYGVSDIGFFFTKWEHGVNLMEDPEKLWNVSPLKYAENINTPLLILHGEKDFRCPIEQGEQLFITLKHLRKEVEFVRFPGANHELSRSGNPSLRIERLNRITEWFDTYL
jgi:acylaminoacyl-peptidase